MTVLTEGNNSFFLSSQAILIENDRDVASDWASKHITNNKSIKWVLGKYVEANNANSNGQYWQLNDLRMSQPTIQHSPMNIGHRPHNIVGTFVASEMIYPTGAPLAASFDDSLDFENDGSWLDAESSAEKYSIPDGVQKAAQRGLELHKKFGRGGTSVGMNTARILSAGGSIGIEKVKHISRYFPRHAGDNLDDKESNGWIAWLLWGGDAGRTWSTNIVERYNKENAAYSQVNPYIEALGAFWKYYFPGELSQVEAAYSSGNLFLSMECVSSSVTCAGPNGCGESFNYAGPMSDTYCEHIKERASYRQLDNPHFLAGALVLPPDRPGWKGAEVKEISKIMNDHAEEAERAYAALSADAPHLSAEQLELAVQVLITNSKKSYKKPASLIGKEIAWSILGGYNV